MATHTRTSNIVNFQLIDFCKYELIDTDPDFIEGNELLDFFQLENTKTGEIGRYKNAYYRGLEFKLYESTIANPIRRITVEGSLHKYWNNGAHNFNDFGIQQIDEVLFDLKVKFKIYPINCILRQLEIGINLHTPYQSKDLIKDCIQHKSKPFEKVYTKDEGTYRQAEYQQYFFKIYDKKTHYTNKGFTIKKETLRIEIKYAKMLPLKKLGIINLKDLLDHGLHNFKSTLLEQWCNIIFYEFKAFRGTKYENLYNNAHWWQGLNYEQMRYHKTNLSNMLSKDPDSIKKEIANLISEKMDYLNMKFPKITPLHIGLITAVATTSKQDENRRFCLVTGLNISMQKKGSSLLSHTGLKYYLKTDKKIYTEVERKYLTSIWKDENLQKQITEIAHNIRNRYNNQKNKKERNFDPRQTKLFDFS